jgi:hypothetical protein
MRSRGRPLWKRLALNANVSCQAWYDPDNACDPIASRKPRRGACHARRLSNQILPG